MQVRAVGIGNPAEARDPVRDRDMETIWCGEFERLQSLVAKRGGKVSIKTARLVGEYPLKVVADLAAQPADSDAITTRLRLVNAIARGRRWLDEMISGAVTDAEQIAVRERCSVRHVNMTISLAFLAPGLVRAAVEGRLPRGINIERLRDAPAEWSRQFEALGLNPQQ
jgi:hypothetical protein